MKRMTVPYWTFLLLLCFGCGSKPQKEGAAAPPSETNELPAALLIREDGSQFSARTLEGNTVLIFFGASCDHCQREATQIHDNLKGFEQYTLFFISMDPFPVMNKFAQDYGISGQPNIHFLRADGASVSSSLGYLQTPTILVYDENRKLIKRFNGETKIEEILKVLKKPVDS